MNAVPASKGLRSAAFILDEALALGIRIGTDGDELVMLVPVRVPYETQKWFATKLDEFRDQIIDFITKENAARTGRGHERSRSLQCSAALAGDAQDARRRRADLQ